MPVCVTRRDAKKNGGGSLLFSCLLRDQIIDLIRNAQRRIRMRNQHDRPALCRLFQRLHDHSLIERVKVAGRLIQQNKCATVQERTDNADALPLAAREVTSLFMDHHRKIIRKRIEGDAVQNCLHVFVIRSLDNRCDLPLSKNDVNDIFPLLSQHLQQSLLDHAHLHRLFESTNQARIARTGQRF